MKEFFYLDTVLLESFLSQKDNGLITDIHEEEYDAHQTSVSIMEVAINAGIEAGLKIIANAMGNLNFSLKNGPITISDTESSRTTMDIKLADNIYDLFYKYIKKTKILKKQADLSKLDVGNYFEKKAAFHFVDFDRVQKLFSAELRTNYESKLDDSVLAGKSIDELFNAIPFLKQTIPYNSFLYFDEMIVLLNPDCIRGDKNAVGYKFENEATILGKISKISPSKPSDTRSPVNNALNEIQDYNLSQLHDFGFTSKKVKYIITPIAIYF